MSNRGRPKTSLREDDKEGHVFVVRGREETIVVGKRGHHRGKEREPGSALSCVMGKNSSHFCKEHMVSVGRVMEICELICSHHVSLSQPGFYGEQGEAHTQNTARGGWRGWGGGLFGVTLSVPTWQELS